MRGFEGSEEFKSFYHEKIVKGNHAEYPPYQFLSFDEKRRIIDAININSWQPWKLEKLKLKLFYEEEIVKDNYYKYPLFSELSFNDKIRLINAIDFIAWKIQKPWKLKIIRIRHAIKTNKKLQENFLWLGYSILMAALLALLN